MNQIVKVQDTESKLRTEPPRTPTREDRRRIIEALDTHYDTKKERYTQNWSDKSLAEALKVPMAWVAEERDRVYGPNINEAASIRDEKLSDLEKKFSQIEDELLKALDNVRNEIAKLKIDLAYKAG